MSITGTAELVREKAKIEELWKPEFRAWFPKGTDEPDIALLRLGIEKAEYWDSPSSTVAHVVSFVSALIKGERANPGENKKNRSAITVTQCGSDQAPHHKRRD